MGSSPTVRTNLNAASIFCDILSANFLLTEQEAYEYVFEILVDLGVDEQDEAINIVYYYISTYSANVTEALYAEALQADLDVDLDAEWFMEIMGMVYEFYFINLADLNPALVNSGSRKSVNQLQALYSYANVVTGRAASSCSVGYATKSASIGVKGGTLTATAMLGDSAKWNNGKATANCKGVADWSKGSCTLRMDMLSVSWTASGPASGSNSSLNFTSVSSKGTATTTPPYVMISITATAAVKLYQDPSWYRVSVDLLKGYA